MANWIDAHCHLVDTRLGETLEQVLESSRRAGVEAWVQGGVSPEDWERQLALRDRLGRKHVAISFGLHPWWVARASKEELSKALRLLEVKLPLADAAGELGLDLSERNGGTSHLEVQASVFRSGLKISRSYRKPLVLHVVRAHTQALEILENEGPWPVGGIVHSFSASKEIASRYLKLGLDLSISGAVTRPGYETLKRAITWLPGQHLIVETDSPDQPPDQASGLNEPARLLEIASAIGALRNEPAESVLDRSAARLRELFFGDDEVGDDRNRA